MAKPDAALLDPARYPFRTEIGTRFADLDPNDHINNVAMAAILEDGRVRFIDAIGFRPRALRFMVVNVTIDYLAQAHYPGALTCLAGSTGAGRSSWIVRQLLLQHGAPVAVAQSTIVCTDGTRPTPISDELRALLQPWMMP